MTRNSKGVIALIALTLAVTGCTAFDRDARDQEACAAIEGAYEAESLREGLRFASARLGRDMFDLSNLQRDLSEGSIVPTPAVGNRLAQLTQSVAVRCAQVGYSTPVANAPSASDNRLSGDEMLAVIDSLSVAPENRTGYDRELFEHWVDDDSDGCNTRDEVLIAESVEPVNLGENCDVLSGRWVSAYDGYESSDPSEFDIDHVVPLAEAWDSGANVWSPAKRRAFANDLTSPLSLIAVSASSNRSKSDGDPNDWLPDDNSYLCQYVSSWLQIKDSWRLSIDQIEKTSLLEVVTTCSP